MTALRRNIAISGCACAIIGICVLLGGYMPNRMFNERAIATSCHRFYTVSSYFCRQGAITSTCYSVHMDTQPSGATCWQAPKVATFFDQSEANRYAAQFGQSNFPCYLDPNNPCTYYYVTSDVVGTLYAGIVFTCVSAILFFLCILMVVYEKRSRYTQLNENAK